MLISPYLCGVIKKDTIMKIERKFTWCVRFYNVKTGAINEFIIDFVASNKDYVVRVFKQYKKF